MIQVVADTAHREHEEVHARSNIALMMHFNYLNKCESISSSFPANNYDGFTHYVSIFSKMEENERK